MRKIIKKALCLVFGHKPIKGHENEHIMLYPSHKINGYRYLYKIDTCQRCVAYSESIKLTEKEYKEEYGMPEPEEFGLHSVNPDEFGMSMDEFMQAIMGTRPQTEEELIADMSMKFGAKKKKKLLH